MFFLEKENKMENPRIDLGVEASAKMLKAVHKACKGESFKAEIEFKSLAEIKPSTRNARKHSKKQQQKIANSIKTFGFNNPILIDENCMVVSGHGRYEAAKFLKLDQVPTICLGHLTEAEIRAFAIADNKLALESEWDYDMLKLEIGDLANLEFDLDATAFETPDIDKLLFSTEIEESPKDDKMDELPDERKVPSVVKPGDLYRVGNHYVYCGNSLDSKSYEILLQGNKANVSVCDYPYNVREMDKARNSNKIQDSISKLSDFSSIKNEVQACLVKGNISESVLQQVIDLIEQDSVKKIKIAEELNKKIAIYQGQATIGKIVNVVIHEGRRPLAFFKSQIKNITYWLNEFKKEPSIDIQNEISTLLSKFPSNIESLAALFKKIDPLSTARRSNKKDYYLYQLINESFDIFEELLIKNRITKKITCNKDLSLYCWEADIKTILLNLLDNSIYWILENKTSDKREIFIEVVEDKNNDFVIHYTDTGKGISEELITSGAIFEPDFSTKPLGEGMGLGLALAGEAASRNGLKLKAEEYDAGAHFIISRESKDKDDK